MVRRWSESLQQTKILSTTKPVALNCQEEPLQALVPTFIGVSMITQEKHQSQVCAQKIWDKPTAKAQIGDYIRAPFVPVMQVIDSEVLSGGQIWLLLKPTTTSHTEEWVLEPEAKQPPTPQPALQRQSTGFSGDSVAYQLFKLEVEPIQPVTTPETAPEPLPDVESQFDTGRTHGQHDASQGWHPIHSQPRTDYARGYLVGYNAVLNPIFPQVEVSNPVEWTVSFDKKWHCHVCSLILLKFGHFFSVAIYHTGLLLPGLYAKCKIWVNLISTANSFLWLYRALSLDLDNLLPKLGFRQSSSICRHEYLCWGWTIL